MAYNDKGKVTEKNTPWCNVDYYWKNSVGWKDFNTNDNALFTNST